MENILLRNRNKSLGKVHQHMLDEGFVLVCDDPLGEVVNWKKTDPWTGAVRILSFKGPNRHTGELVTTTDGRMFIK